MQKLLVTSALISALATGMALAQTTTTDPATTTAPESTTAAPGSYDNITVPEGFVRQETALTADDLMNAKIYDVRGESVGEIEDLVLASGGLSSTAGTTTDPAATATETTTNAADAAGETATGQTSTGEISHALIDVGGFLGMGEHRIAAPISDLLVYRSDNETRVYLPWTEDQMRALPAYDETKPETLGKSVLPEASN